MKNYKLIPAIAFQSIIVCKLEKKLLSRVTKHMTSFSDHYLYVTFLSKYALWSQSFHSKGVLNFRRAQRILTAHLFIPSLGHHHHQVLLSAQPRTHPSQSKKNSFSVPESCRLYLTTDQPHSLPITQAEQQQRYTNPLPSCSTFGTQINTWWAADLSLPSSISAAATCSQRAWQELNSARVK